MATSASPLASLFATHDTSTPSSAPVAGAPIPAYIIRPYRPPFQQVIWTSPPTPALRAEDAVAWATRRGWNVTSVVDLGDIHDPAVATMLGVAPYHPSIGPGLHWFELWFTE